MPYVAHQTTIKKADDGTQVIININIKEYLAHNPSDLYTDALLMNTRTGNFPDGE